MSGVNPLVLFGKNHESSFAYVFSKLHQLNKISNNGSYINSEETKYSEPNSVINKAENVTDDSVNKDKQSIRITELEIENSKLKVALGYKKCKELMQECIQFYESVNIDLICERESPDHNEGSESTENGRIKNKLKEIEENLHHKQLLLDQKCIELNQTQILLSRKCLDLAKLKHSYHLLLKQINKVGGDSNNNDLEFYNKELKVYANEAKE